jgi:hypothetical protein
MATAFGTNFKDRTTAFPDIVLAGQALPNNTTLTTAAFDFAKIDGRIELEIRAKTQIVIADTKTLKIELLWDRSAGGAFASSRVINAYAASGAAITIPAGTVIGLITPETDVEQFAKIKFTTTADQTAHTVDAKLFYRA